MKVTNKSVLPTYSLAAAALGIAYATHGEFPVTLLGRPRDEVKPHTTLQAFYEFYLNEHRDPTCRLLHIIGTTMVTASLLTNYRFLLPSLATGVSCGLMLSEYLSCLSNGLVEFVAVFAITYLVALRTNKPFPWHVLVMGYLPAWIGHFFFEHNRPATFKYLTYSLLSDFVMWYQTLTGHLPLNQRL